MAISVDYSVTPWLITVPKADLTLDVGTKYKLTVNTFWSLLRNYADSAEALPNPVIYSRIQATSSTPSITDVNLDYYQIQFEDGAYSVNIIDGNTNIREAEVKNQVSVNTNNTTGFIDAKFLEHSTFGTGPTIDVTFGYAGTAYPIGTEGYPSSNTTDILSILQERGFNEVNVSGDLTVSSTDFSKGYRFKGKSPFHILTANASADLSNCALESLTIIGEMDGLNVIQDCEIGAITNVSGHIENSYLTSSIEMNGDLVLANDYSHKEGSGYPTVIVTIGNLIVRDFRGSLGLVDITSGTHSMGIGGGGRAVIEASCIGGTIHVRGNPFEIIDNSGIGCTVLDETESSTIRAIYALLLTLVDDIWSNVKALSIKKFMGLK